MSDAQWSSVLDVNLSAPFRVSREMCRRLVAQGGPGCIVHGASILGHPAKAMFVHCGTTKGTLMHLTQATAFDLLPHRIRVNALAPGHFPTETTNPFFETDAGRQQIGALPPGRLGRLDEPDGPLLLLASEASSCRNGWGAAPFVTGKLSDRLGRHQRNAWGLWICGAGVALMPLGSGQGGGAPPRPSPASAWRCRTRT